MDSQDLAEAIKHVTEMAEVAQYNADCLATALAELLEASRYKSGTGIIQMETLRQRQGHAQQVLAGYERYLDSRQAAANYAPEVFFAARERTLEIADELAG